MAYNIIIGRNEEDRKRFGEKGVVYIGKQYVKMGQTSSLSNKVFLDVTRSHVVLVAGKRGSGKSYSLSVIAESIAKMPKEIAENLSVILLDTMGIFWTMEYPNEKDEKLLEEWGLEPEKLDVNLWVPKGFYEKYREQGINADYSFAIKPEDLTAEDWRLTFGLRLNEPVAVLIEKIIYEFEEENRKDYSIKEIIEAIKKDEKTGQNTRNAAINMFRAADSWGLFDREGTNIQSLIEGGKVTVLDVSSYTTGKGGWGVKSLVIGLVAKKLFQERIIARKEEEIENIKEGSFEEEEKMERPLVWMLLDEAHEMLPERGKTPATDALITVLREGRQPGLSLVLATQQPGKIHRDVMTQSDIVLSHRVTARPDVEALNSMMQTYLTTDILTQLNNLPDDKGSGIILDDNSERIYPVRIRPKHSWHGGEAPTAIREKKKLDLGL